MVVLEKNNIYSISTGALYKNKSSVVLESQKAFVFLTNNLAIAFILIL